MAQLLIERHLPRWADRVDYSTLDSRPTEVVAGDFTVRRMDLLSAGRAKDGATEVLLLLELQGKRREHMATRSQVYAGLAAQRERKRHRDRGETPPPYRALTLVLFHGDGSWTASLRSEELHGKGGPDCYVVVVPRPLGAPDPELHDLPELVLGLGRRISDEQMAAELRLLRDAVDLSGRDDVDEVVVRTVRKLLRLRGYPEDLIRRMDTMHAAVEVFQRSWRETELRGERKGVEKGRREGRREGRQEGRREGRQEGRREGRRRLCRMAARKFDADTVRELAALLDRMADPARLDEAAEAIMDCDASEALLRMVRRVATE